MLEKLITNLKNSLPGAKKNAGAEDSENVEDSEESQEESGGSSSAEEEKKKKISMIIRVVVILGLGYTAVDHFFLSSEPEPSIEELTAAAAKRKRPKPSFKKAEESAPNSVPAVSATANGGAAGAVSTEDPLANTDSIEPAADVPADAPVENINILDKNETATTDSVSPQTGSEKTVTPAIEATPKTALGEAPKSADPNLDQRLDQLIDTVEKKEETKESNMADKIEDKIEEEVAYTPPPAYDVLGRGLVYNCKDKFWACIDKPGYVVCNKNMKYNQSKGSAQECVVQNVYNSEEDCAKVQKYNVSTSQATTFCQ